MPRKQYTPEQIIDTLRQPEVELAQGATIPIVCRKLGVTDQTCHRWRKEYGGLRVVQAKRVRKQYENHVPVKTIAREAVGKGLHPFGTNKTPAGAGDQVESCRCAVYRVIRSLKREAERAQRLRTEETTNEG
jgi:putative transposase